MFLNTQGAGKKEPFACVSAVSGLDFPDDGRAIALVDWDHDGDQDLWISNRNAPRLRFLRNDTPNNSHFLQLRLQGNGTTTNRDGIGARVEVLTSPPKSAADANASADQPRSIKTLRAGDGFLAQSSKWLHFGLGNVDQVESVTVRWPGGAQETFAGCQADRRFVLVQGTGEASELRTQSKRALSVAASAPELLPPAAGARVPLIARLTMPRFEYEGFDGDQHLLAIQSGRPLLVNLWSSSCRPCRAELKEWTDNKEQIRAAGIDVVALSVDRIGDDSSGPDSAVAFLREQGFPFAAGFADSTLVQFIQNVHDSFIVVPRPLPVPCSFLIDRSGAISIIYKGRVLVDTLVEDAREVPQGLAQRFKRSAQVAGSLIDHEMAIRSIGVADREARAEFASALNRGQQSYAAMIYYRDLIEDYPDFAEAYFNRGMIYRGRGKPALALEDFSKAIQRKPDFVAAYNNRGSIQSKLGNYELALNDYGKAIELDPLSAQAINNLAWLLATCPDKKYRDGREAIIRAQQALELAGEDDWSILDSLAAANAEAGDFARAVETQSRAVKLAPEVARAELRSRLDLYAARKPYRESVGN